MKRFKKLTPVQKERVANEVKLMMAAHRDCLWTRWVECTHPQAIDPTTWSLSCNEGYYGEAFGVMRGLVAMGFGYFGSDNLNAVDEQRSDVPEHNCKWWFQELCRELLNEEGFYTKSCTPEKAANILAKYQELVRQ